MCVDLYSVIGLRSVSGIFMSVVWAQVVPGGCREADGVKRHLGSLEFSLSTAFSGTLSCEMQLLSPQLRESTWLCLGPLSCMAAWTLLLRDHCLLLVTSSVLKTLVFFLSVSWLFQVGGKSNLYQGCHDEAKILLFHFFFNPKITFKTVLKFLYDKVILFSVSFYSNNYYYFCD